MVEPRPIRLRLSRRAGYSVHLDSEAANGLPILNVTRPGPWGNKFRVGIEASTHVEAVAMHRKWLCDCIAGRIEDYPKEPLVTLRGYNLACWCPLAGPCHADTLLELANR